MANHTKVRSFLGDKVDFDMIKLKQELSAAPAAGEPAFTLSLDNADPLVMFNRSDLAASQTVGRLNRRRKPEPVSAPVAETTEPETSEENHNE